MYLLQVVNEDIFVQDSTGKKVESQLLPVIDASLSFRDYHTMAYLGVSPNVIPTHWLAFSATVPPLGFSTYIISSDKGAGEHKDHYYAMLLTTVYY